MLTTCGMLLMIVRLGGVIEPVGDDDLDDEQEETVIMTARPHPVHCSPVEILPRSGECTKQQR